jgi:hypothetical protein
LNPAPTEISYNISVSSVVEFLLERGYKSIFVRPACFFTWETLKGKSKAGNVGLEQHFVSFKYSVWVPLSVNANATDRD